MFIEINHFRIHILRSKPTTKDHSRGFHFLDSISFFLSSHCLKIKMPGIQTIKLELSQFY